MKVLHFIDSLVSGGKERQLVELIKGLKAYKDITCELAIMSHDIHYKEVFDLNIRIHYLIRKKKKDPRIFFKLYNLCKKIKPDIIHSWESMPSIYASPVAKLLSIKFINGIIRDASLKRVNSNLRLKLTIPFSDVILSNSYAGLCASSLPMNKSVYIHNGFDFKRLNHLQAKDILKKKLGLSAKKIVGMVASFSVRKDYQSFISAAEFVLSNREDVVFLAIGSGINLEASKKLVKPEFRNKIRFLGKQRDVESIINILDIGILTTNTRFHAEGISNSIMEYMALSKPVIATDSGGTNEIVIDGLTGFIVKPYDVNTIYIKILELLEDENLATKMGEAGRKRLSRYFSLEQMSHSIAELYKATLKNFDSSLINLFINY